MERWVEVIRLTRGLGQSQFYDTEGFMIVPGGLLCPRTDKYIAIVLLGGICTQGSYLT